jgi:cation diffusion facilitator CzcD-associated flavoprotein CzcO
MLTRMASDWKWPNIPGLQSFKGELVHTASWNPKLSTKDKKVAVLGCGSSGVQIIPKILPGTRVEGVVEMACKELILCFQMLNR